MAGKDRIHAEKLDFLYCQGSPPAAVQTGHPRLSCHPTQGSLGVCPTPGAGKGPWVSARRLAAGWRGGPSLANSKQPAARQGSWKGFKAISSLFCL